MKQKITRKALFLFIILFSMVAYSVAQETVYNNFGEDHEGWNYNYGTGWTVSGTDVTQQYGVEQALGFESSGTGYVCDLWVAILYCNPSSLPDTVVLFLVENPDGLPPDSAYIMEEWTIYDFNSWSQWSTPIHLTGDGSSYLEQGKSYWLWAIGKETTWTMWCINEDPALTCPHTLRREGEDWLSISNETASAFRIDVETNVGVNTLTTEKNSLAQNYPNPFQSSTFITYNIAKPDNIKIAVYDIFGKQVKVLIDQYNSKGSFTLNFSPENLQNGLYILEMTSGNKLIERKKIIYQK